MRTKLGKFYSRGFEQLTPLLAASSLARAFRALRALLRGYGHLRDAGASRVGDQGAHLGGYGDPRGAGVLRVVVQPAGPRGRQCALLEGGGAVLPEEESLGPCAVRDWGKAIGWSHPRRLAPTAHTLVNVGVEPAD